MNGDFPHGYWKLFEYTYQYFYQCVWILHCPYNSATRMVSPGVLIKVDNNTVMTEVCIAHCHAVIASDDRLCGQDCILSRPVRVLVSNPPVHVFPQPGWAAGYLVVANVGKDAIVLAQVDRLPEFATLGLAVGLGVIPAVLASREEFNGLTTPVGGYRGSICWKERSKEELLHERGSLGYKLDFSWLWFSTIFSCGAVRKACDLVFARLVLDSLPRLFF